MAWEKPGKIIATENNCPEKQEIGKALAPENELTGAESINRSGRQDYCVSVNLHALTTSLCQCESQYIDGFTASGYSSMH